MNEVCGLIAIETIADRCHSSHDDTTLDRLFARLVGLSNLELVGVACENADPTLILAANLDSLAEDLNAVMREVLAELFLSVGRR
jgi:hypothetical protein